MSLNRRRSFTPATNRSIIDPFCLVPYIIIRAVNRGDATLACAANGA